MTPTMKSGQSNRNSSQNAPNERQEKWKQSADYSRRRTVGSDEGCRSHPGFRYSPRRMIASPKERSRGTLQQAEEKTRIDGYGRGEAKQKYANPDDADQARSKSLLVSRSRNMSIHLVPFQTQRRDVKGLTRMNSVGPN